MKSFLPLLTAAACLTVAVLSPAAHAQQILDINFDADTVGAAPATDLATTPFPLTKPYSIGGYDSNPLPVDDPGYQSPPTATTGTIVVSGATKNTTWTTNSADNQIGALWMDTQYAVPAQTLNLSFNLNVLSASTSTAQSFTLTTDSSTVHPVFGINTFSSGDTLRFTAVPTSNTGGVYGIRTDAGTIVPFYDYVNGDDHLLELNADYSTGTVNVLVDGVSQLSNYAFGSPNADITLFESFLYLNGDTTAVSPMSNSVAIDNISASAIPEPASLSLLALGGLTLLARRRRNA